MIIGIPVTSFLPLFVHTNMWRNLYPTPIHFKKISTYSYYVEISSIAAWLMVEEVVYHFFCSCFFHLNRWWLIPSCFFGGLCWIWREHSHSSMQFKFKFFYCHMYNYYSEAGDGNEIPSNNAQITQNKNINATLLFSLPFFMSWNKKYKTFSTYTIGIFLANLVHNFV